MFTSVSLSLFRVLSPIFIFSCTTIASILHMSRENETWRQCFDLLAYLLAFSYGKSPQTSKLAEEDTKVLIK